MAWVVHVKRAVWTIESVHFSETRARWVAEGLQSNGYETRVTPLVPALPAESGTEGERA